MPAAKPPVIILTGPTATGKTATAIRLASDVDIDVINGDSRLFYRGMDIGIAKPSKAERAIAPHHLIDTLDPRDAMSLAQFQDQANALIVDIHARNRLPVIVGGTQQYHPRSPEAGCARECLRSTRSPDPGIARETLRLEDRACQ